MAPRVHPWVALEDPIASKDLRPSASGAVAFAEGVYDYRSALDVGPYTVRLVPRERQPTLKHRARFADTWTRVAASAAREANLHARVDDVSARTGGPGWIGSEC